MSTFLPRMTVERLRAAADHGTGRRDVVLSHPGTQHVHEVAIALEGAGRLRRFYSSWFFDRRSLARRAATLLSVGRRQQLDTLLDKHSNAAILRSRVRSWPYAEALSRSFGRWPLLPESIRGRLQYPFVNALFDRHVARRLATLTPHPAAVYGFLGASERTFTAARACGIATLLDVPIVLDALEVIETENAVRGVTDRSVGVPHARMHREIVAADWIVVPSAAVARSIQRVERRCGRVSVVPFGVDTAQFVPAARQGVRPGRLDVLFAGRLEPRKGVDYLIEAWRELPDTWTLWLAGSPGTEPYMRQLRARYRGTVSEVGNLSRDALARFLQAGDVFVFPSLAEGSALVTYEALAAGMPCIVTAEAGSVVRDGIEGFVVPARDPAAIAARLNLLAANSELRRRMAGAARRRAEWFTWARYHSALLTVVDHLTVTDDPRRRRADHHSAQRVCDLAAIGRSDAPPPRTQR